jgi:putative ABC transport system ATP-binding protein
VTLSGSATSTVTGSDARTVVELQDVHKHYHMGAETVRALNGVSLSFHQGQFWAVMGPSGSGKSTLLNLLGCLDHPTSGSYFLDGHDVSRLNDDQLSQYRLRHLGFIFQSFNLIPQLTVQENIELPLFYLGWDARKSARRARELADSVGLGDRLGHRPRELSGGQQQRVAVARALSNDPTVLLADEPTGNLDSQTSDQIMQVLSGLHAQGKTILLVTHEPDIAAWAPLHLHMKDGCIDRVVESGR